LNSAFLSAAAFFSASVSFAQVAVYEGFTDYAVGASIVAGDGGIGFAGPWTSRRVLLNSGPGLNPDAIIEVRAQSLAYSDGVHRLLANGGSLFLSGENGDVQLARTVDQAALPHVGEDPKTGEITYISYLAWRLGEAADPDDPIYGGNYPYGGNLYPRNAGLDLFGDDNGDAIQLLFGNPSNSSDNVWRFQGQDIDGVNKDPRSTAPFGGNPEPNFVVIKIEHGVGSDGADKIRMWVDPFLHSEADNGGAPNAFWRTRDDPLYMQPGWIGLEVGGGDALRPAAALAFDEFRIGPSWASVTPYERDPEGGWFVSEALGWLHGGNAPWYYSLSLEKYVYGPNFPARGGQWLYFSR
jgi:hypothetical protein